MSIQTMTRVWSRSTHSGTELLLLLAIADFADDHGTAWPSVETLARKARTTRRHVQRLLGRLVDSGELRVTRRSRSTTSHGVSATHLYQVLVAVDNWGDKMSPLPPEGRPTGHGGGDLQVQRGATYRSHEPSLELSYNKVLSTLGLQPPSYPQGRKPKTPAQVKAAVKRQLKKVGREMPA